jgi:hypothetical protein
LVEGRVELLRVRRYKVGLIDRAAARLKTLSSEESVAAGFGQKAQLLQVFDRYERRAPSKRSQALNKLSAERGRKTERE